MTSTVDMDTFNALKNTASADFTGQLIGMFLDKEEQTVAELRRALAGNDAAVFCRTAHTLKSNAMTFGAMHLGELAKELERIGRENRLGAVGDKLTTLEAEYSAVCASLKELLAGL